MHTINISTFLHNQLSYIEVAKKHAVFVYPTDTIYGLGGIVTPEVIEKITACKQRPSHKHYSIIAPNFSWIQQYFEVSDNFEKKRWELYEIHGPLTLILPLKSQLPSDKGVKLSKASEGGAHSKKERASVHLLTGNNKVGIRYLPHHPMQDFVTGLGTAFITTSANISGQPNITHPSQLTPKQETFVDLAIDTGTLTGSGSTIIEYPSMKRIR